MASDHASQFDTLLLEREGAVATLTINRPQVLNALDARTLEELGRAMRALQADDEVRAIVITGAGEKAFAAGADINEIARQTPAGARDLASTGQQIFDLVETMGKPVVAAINGYALGGGCELAMACTLRIASDTARLGQPEINLGLIPGYGGTQRLSRLVGRGRALEILLSGDPVAAADAERLGLVNRVVPAASLLTEARAWAASLARKPPIAVRAIIDAVNAGRSMPFHEAGAFEAALFGVVAGTDDMREGTRAFLEKRKPVFTGK